MIDQSILDLCIRVNGMTAYYPQYDKVSETPLEPTPEMVGKYGWNNGRVAFVTPKGDYYVTPYCVEVADYLTAHGYQNGYIYVPFSNWDEPSDPLEAQKWKKLCVAARQLHNEKEKERRRENIKNISRSKGIKELPQEVYDMSLLIPDEGLKTKHLYTEESVTMPVPDFDLKDTIGTYYQNNGRVVFVDNKGKTYVTPYCHEVRQLLSEAGYRERGLYVPLSNGEAILDPQLSARWKELCLGARQAYEVRAAEEKKTRIADIAKKKGISSLPEEAYRLVFEIPEDGIETVWFGDRHSVTTPVGDFDLESTIGTYDQNNGRVVFVDDKGKTYVTPFCSELRAVLQQAGYREGSMFVPFSNGEVPVNEMLLLKWKQLCTIANQAYEKREQERKVTRLMNLAKGKGLSELPQEVYELSMKIPKEGFETIFFGSERDMTRPVRDFELEHTVGTLCQNNGRLVFVDDKGETYVTPHCLEVTQMLRDAGYKEGSLFVPLSNGESIVDPQIAHYWERLCARLPEVGSGPKM